MNEVSKRLEYLIQEEGLNKLKSATVMIVGVGGVGGFACEALARSFVGRLILVDHDDVSLSNINRQIIATIQTVGQPKVEVMKERIKLINPDCEVIALQKFFTKEEGFFGYDVDYVVDAIDTLSSKMDLIELCAEKNVPIICSLGMGNRLDPTQIKVTTLDKTNYDPLARALRNLVKKRNFKKKIKVIFSMEQPLKQTQVDDPQGKTRKEILPPSSSAFVPSAAGLACASVVVSDLIKK